ncbi:MAG: PadR family transcriptional regulator [Firmicutes bacterium HGW-Firmicutes-19]|jgi:PadR family transcriptional regulator, regulatory protein PadR|nr:MAG: PadR family transcriptional regulator [Firmicutes bacterium HGW-Firmicutes-19]
MSEYVKKRLFHGFVCMHILHHAKEHPVYGSWMVEELAHHGYKMSYGTLYPILHDLEKEGLLTSSSMTVEGKIRKYYTITSLGESALEELRSYLRELTDEVQEKKDEQ